MRIWLKIFVLTGIFLLLTTGIAQAFNVFFYAQVNYGAFSPMSPSCYEHTLWGSLPLGPVRPFLGETVIVSIIPNTANIPIPQHPEQEEFERCADNGNLVEF